MIVYCEKCNSKFQVDDAKIPDAGIKARCSVCSHAFLLKKEPVVAAPTQPARPAEPIQQKESKSEFEPSVFKDSPAEADAGQSNLVGAGGPFFSRTATASEAASETANNDVVVEVASSTSFDEEIFAAHEQESAGLAEAFTAEPAQIAKPAAGYDAFAAFVERQKDSAASTAAEPERPRFTFNTATPSATEPQAAKATENNATVSAIRVPEVVSSADGQLPAAPIMGRTERAIIAKLDDRGMTDDYVVEMVQEVCQAVKYVEGMEKPDWPTRMMGLEMLCKIRGLYAGEKRDDPTNRQLQIVAGINM